MKTAFPVLSLILTQLAVAPFPVHAVQSDDRLVLVHYQDGEVVPLQSTAGGGLMIIFAPEERVLGFDIADPNAVSIDAWMGQGSLFVKTQSQPNEPKISVRTQLRSYVFSVETGPPDTAAAVVRFKYDSVIVPEKLEAAPEVSQVQYRITGDKALRPLDVSDDGVHTYVTWHPDQALPAVFAINPSGEEEIVDGYMRNDVFTIDRVHPKLVFRIDRRTAKADRLSR
jgi:type IV secretion system protein VirB9